MACGDGQEDGEAGIREGEQAACEVDLGHVDGSERQCKQCEARWDQAHPHDRMADVGREVYVVVVQGRRQHAKPREHPAELRNEVGAQAQPLPRKHGLRQQRLRTPRSLSAQRCRN